MNSCEKRDGVRANFLHFFGLPSACRCHPLFLFARHHLNTCEVPPNNHSVAPQSNLYMPNDALRKRGRDPVEGRTRRTVGQSRSARFSNFILWRGSSLTRLPCCLGRPKPKSRKPSARSNGVLGKKCCGKQRYERLLRAAGNEGSGQWRSNSKTTTQFLAFSRSKRGGTDFSQGWARISHPDVAKDKSVAEEKFKEINEAYEVLSDPEKRKKYDTLGQKWKFHFDGTGFSDFSEQFFVGGRGFGEFEDPFGRGGIGCHSRGESFGEVKHHGCVGTLKPPDACDVWFIVYNVHKFMLR